MKKKEVLNKYNLLEKEFRMLIKLNKIIKIENNLFEIAKENEDYIKNGNYEQFKKDYHNTDEYKKKISERNIKVNQARWAKMTNEDRKLHSQKCKAGVLRAYKENPEIIENIKNSLKEYWSNQENRDKQSIKMSQVYQDETKRNNLKKACKLYWSNEEARKAKSEYMLKYWKEHPEVIERMKEANRQTQAKIWTEEKCKKQSNILKDIWNKDKENIIEKMINTMKENNSFNTSKPAEECKELLKSFGFTIKEEYPYPNNEWKCDVYIIELDTYIEFHFGIFHGPKEFHEPFDKNNIEHLKVKKWLEDNFRDKLKSKYHYLLYTWTDLDVRKKDYAENNNLNWFAFYTIGDFKQWLEILMN